LQLGPQTQFGPQGQQLFWHPLGGITFLYYFISQQAQFYVQLQL